MVSRCPTPKGEINVEPVHGKCEIRILKKEIIPVEFGTMLTRNGVT